MQLNQGTDQHLEMTAGKVKMIYLLMYMGFAFWRVFYNVYLEEIGFTGAAIGTLNAIMQSSVIIVLPIWGMVADKHGIRPTLRWLIIIAAILVFMLGYIKIFYVLIAYILILTIFHHPLGPLADALAVQYSHIDKRHSYGSFRSWGSLGWAIASIIGGVIFTFVDIKYVFPLASIFFICTAYFLRTPKKRRTIYRPDFQPIDFRLVLKDYHLLFFVIILSIYGIACSPVNAYTNLYFKELGAKNDAIGLAYAIQAFSEVPFFFIGGKLVIRFGARRVILISMAVMVLRLFIYSITENVAIALSLGALQGITLSFFLVGAVDFIHRLLPAGRHATAQSFIWGLYFGVGHTIGNLSIGVLKDIKGMSGVMYIFAFFAVGVLFITFIYFYLSRFKKQVHNLSKNLDITNELKPPELS